MNKVNNGTRLGYIVIFYGGIWGLVEASLGFLLHSMGDILPIPSLSGTILFPLGLYLMIRAMRSSGRVEAVPLTALVAAIIKAASVILPFVSLRFVRNPAMAILLEGALVWAVVGVSDWKYDRLLPVRAAAVSFGWRVAFILLNRGLGLSGIANKPAVVQRNFVILDGGIDMVLIVAACLIASLVVRPKDDRIRRGPSIGPVPAFAAVLLGFGGQALFAVL